MPDKRALKILFDTYWSSAGWKSAGDLRWTPQTPADDLAFATRAGVMFPPRKLRHQDALQRIGELRAAISPQMVGSAFVASLTSGEVGVRSALGSYAVALHMPLHRFTPEPGTRHCVVCGDYDEPNEQDVNILNFERHKWGGVRHEQPTYIAFDLERFAIELSVDSLPSTREPFVRLLDSVRSLPSGAKLADLVRTIKPIVPGNDAQRRTVVSLLGYAGVLRIPSRSGFFRSFTPAANREETPWYKDDWPYPTRWWRGGHGIDQDAVSFWFGHL